MLPRISQDPIREKESNFDKEYDPLDFSSCQSSKADPLLQELLIADILETKKLEVKVSDLLIDTTPKSLESNNETTNPDFCPLNIQSSMAKTTQKGKF